ncbi:hypothetical protein BDN72DRAFT_834709 [Pluteus cervinus]|uniref:Uncharacterized protein n=1 Tax=Pluteus cervinus TaxID=181527 RepID=A0ACD3B788_9AGAR|nr:hypothetical protein BDN72DRAFT_834709 [Pluteus cervinus]
MVFFKQWYCQNMVGNPIVALPPRRHKVLSTRRASHCEPSGSITNLVSKSSQKATEKAICRSTTSASQSLVNEVCFSLRVMRVHRITCVGKERQNLRCTVWGHQEFELRRCILGAVASDSCVKTYVASQKIPNTLTVSMRRIRLEEPDPEIAWNHTGVDLDVQLVTQREKNWDALVHVLNTWMLKESPRTCWRLSEQRGFAASNGLTEAGA